MVASYLNKNRDHTAVFVVWFSSFNAKFRPINVNLAKYFFEKSISNSTGVSGDLFLVIAFEISIAIWF